MILWHTQPTDNTFDLNTLVRLEVVDVIKLTRIISAKLHEQLLEDMCILGEEPAIGLREHLVHRLL